MRKPKPLAEDSVYFRLRRQVTTESGQDLKGRNLEAGMEADYYRGTLLAGVAPSGSRSHVWPDHRWYHRQ